MTRIHDELAHRRRLIGDLRHAPRWALLITVVGMFVIALMPSVAAIAIGRVADRLSDASEVTTATLLLIVVVVIGTVGGLVLEQFLEPLRQHSQDRITEAARAEARELLLAPRGVEGYDNQQTLNDGFTLTRGLGTWTYGEGVEGQLALFAWSFERVFPAIIVATYSWWLGVYVWVVAETGHQFLNRFYKIGALKVVVPQQTQQRELKYWASVVGGAQTGKEVRTFGFGKWATQHQRDVASKMHQLSFDYVLSILPKQWPAFVIGAVGLGVPILVARDRILDGTTDAGAVATMLAATIAAFMVDGGEEPFAFVAARQVDRARQRLRGEASRATTSSYARVDKVVFNSEIVFDSVAFRYPGSDVDVLHECSLTIHRGETLAIVGANGAGKTTLIKLLSGMYEPTSGCITVGGLDLASVDIAAWRRHLAVVFQDFTHFELTVADNVGLSELGAVHADRARRAIDHAVAHHDEDRGLSSLLTRRFDGGLELSGGQWQRIALARAFYALDAGRDVLVMDEPTANLDVRSELRLFDTLRQQAGDATVVFLSHRFSTVRRADRIVVLEGGRVLEDGSHDALIALGGRYAEMFRTQAASFGGDT